MKSVIFIPYFGTSPSWMEYFLESCRWNPEFQWILPGDFGLPSNCPANVFFQRMTLDELNRLAGTRLGLKIEISNPYKICDLRPAFGVIFSDFLGDADFWGYSDLDLVYGQLGNFLTPGLLQSFDVISTREKYFTGHFSLYRNTPGINRLYEHSSRYKKVFETGSKHYAFDEISNLTGRRLRSPEEKKSNSGQGKQSPGLADKLLYRMIKSSKSLPDMNTVIGSLEKDGAIRVHRKDLVRSDNWYLKRGKTDWKVIWKDGILRSEGDGRELLHFHFLKSKNKKGFLVDAMQNTKAFSVTSSGIRSLGDSA